MTAFDTGTNTGSTTFTNSWGTVELLPSASVQKATGFARTSGWLYFEMKIDDQGGDNSRLFVGHSSPQFAASGADALWGGLDKFASAAALVFSPPYPYTPSAAGISLTACTGDVFMFALDLTGGGRNHLGVQIVLTTSDGAGNILLPFFGEVGKNGVWSGSGRVGFSWPAHGYPMQAQPWTARDSTSGATAKVSLRVETTSFAYAIPAGMTAYGDGPEGGGARTNTYSIAWDPTRVFGSGTWSLTGSNYFAVHSVSAAATFYQMVQSTPLPPLADAAGRRVVEFRVNQGGGNQFPYFALVDASATTSLTYCSSAANNYAFLSGSIIGRTGVATSVTNAGQGAGTGVEPMPVQQFVVDHTTQRVWATNMKLNGGVNWLGTVAAARSSPYKSGGINGFTITDSVGLRWQVGFEGFRSLSNVEINVGQKPFIAYPLMQGVVSYNGARQVYGTGDHWLPGLTSMCYSHSNFGIGTNNPNITIITVNGKKNSGKWFFQVWHGSSNVAVGLTHATGLRPDSMTTLSSVAATKNNLVWDPFSTDRKTCRYSITSTSTLTGFSTASWQAFWESVAVDFTAGKLWFGVVNPMTGLNVWANGGDPAAGSNPLLTFTASTTLVPVTYLITAAPEPSKPTIFVAETNNVVDMPSGFTAWNGSGPETSLTATPSAAVPTTTASGGLRVLWPYGVQT